ncbi:tyrosine-type recombinase/integrase [Lysinibacillus xylanilyticus]|uniref:tyrosine-type recombinase/integrase n=1 Tax=Lysinibacillus xylanilyticus TaxID=582475 RepID=UPI00382BB6BD
MYSVRKVTMLTIDGEKQERFHILKEGIPVFRINNYLDSVSANHRNTVKQYANRICKYLNFLSVRDKNYKTATLKDVLRFIDFLLFDCDSFFYIGEGKVTYSTVSHYLTVIKELYKYLEDEEVDINIHVKKEIRSNKNSYLYGQIWGIKMSKILEKRILKTRNIKEYHKWYTENEKEALFSNFSTHRDKAVFLLTLEGLRIDEVLSLRISDYNPINCEIHLFRSKGKRDGNVGSTILLPNKVVKVIDDYIYHERDTTLIRFHDKFPGEYPQELFLNIKNNEYMGRPLSYRNYLKILKRVAEKAEMNPEKIRTHSGRSTKTMELLHHQVMHPEDNITDEHIRQLMRWSNPNSIQPYINHFDKRLLIESAKKIYKRNENIKNNTKDYGHE